MVCKRKFSHFMRSVFGSAFDGLILLLKNISYIFMVTFEGHLMSLMNESKKHLSQKSRQISETLCDRCRGGICLVHEILYNFCMLFLPHKLNATLSLKLIQRQVLKCSFCTIRVYEAFNSSRPFADSSARLRLVVFIY